MHRLERAAAGLIAFATIAIVLVSVALVVWTQTRLRDELDLIRHTREVTDALGGVHEALDDVENPARDYVLSADDRYFQLYQSRLPEIGRRLDVLRALVANAPSQLDRFRRLEGLIGQEMDVLARLAGFVQSGERERAVTQITVDAGPPLASGIDTILNGMRGVEQAELQARRRIAEDNSTRLIEGSIAVGVATLAILILGLQLMRSQQRQRRAAEADLRQSERLLNSIFTNAQVGIALADADGVLQRANATFSTLIGRPGEELGGLPVKQLSLEGETGIEFFLGAAPTPSEPGEVVVEQLDGSKRTLIAVGTELGIATGIVRLATFTDITRLKQVQADLEASRHRSDEQRVLLDAVLNSSIDSILAFAAERDAEGRLLQFRCILGNRAAARLRRRPLASLAGTPLGKLLVDTEHFRLNDEFERVIRTGEFFEAEREVQEPVIGPRWYRMVAVPLGDGVMVTLGDITDRKRLESELRAAATHLVEREGRLTAIYDSVLDGIITINPSGQIESFNRAAARIFNYAPDQVMRRNIHMLMPEPYASAHDSYLERYVATGQSRILGTVREIEGKRADGSIFPMEIALTETVLGSGRLFVAAVRDVTERRALERVKSEFVSTVSHELRTPLTSISGALSLIASGTAGPLPEKAQSLVTIARSNCERLTRLIADILDLERIDAGRMVFEFAPVALEDLLSQVHADNIEYARKYGVSLELSATQPRATLWADLHRLIQVLTNLISNAVKFSPSGGRVAMSAIIADTMVRIAVQDSGRGIPESFRDRVFEKFAQADTADNRQKGGTGLGLSIVKSIVERHGGSVSFESPDGGGTTFFVDLPRRRPPLAELADLTVPMPRVLICEDDPDVATVLAAQLQEAGYRADRAATADTAFRLLAERRYDAMTLDLALPDTDGLSLLRRVRENPRHSDMPVIIISAWIDSPAGKAASLEGEVLGIVDWLGKPIDQTRLLHTLNEIPKRASRPHVLHVEDDPDVARLVNLALRDLADITSVPSVAEARATLQAGGVDLMILDIGLTDGSGLALLDGDDPKPPTVLFTGQEAPPERHDELVAVLVKSQTTLDQLASLIREQLAVPI
jgi:PAS domain S-box-containing protein